METVDFSSQEDAISFVKGKIPHFQEEDDITVYQLVESLELVSKEHSDAKPSKVIGFPMLVKRYRWVVRNDDLNLLDCIFEGLRGSASAGFFVTAGVPNPTQWGGLVGLGMAIFKAIRGAVLRGKQLDPQLFTILALLKRVGPLSEAGILSRVSSADPKWRAEDVQQTLEALSAVPMNDGTVRQLVSKNHDGVWQVSGV